MCDGLTGHFDLQSSAYELEEHLQRSSSDHISVEHLTTTFSTKAPSRWTSIRPHLSSSIFSAEQGLKDAYDSRNPRLAHHFGSNSLPSGALFGRNVNAQIYVIALIIAQIQKRTSYESHPWVKDSR